MKAAVWATLAVVLLGGADARGQELPAPQHGDGFHEGVSVGMYFEDESTTYLPYLWELANAGASTVSLVIEWIQDDVRATSLRPLQRTPSDETLRRTIREARSLGLDVMLLPIVRLETRGDGDWRGRLDPSDIDAWFASYTEFMLRYAALASDEGVVIFSVGSELGSMERYDEAWRTIIQRVRQVYGGTLTYSANWDNYFNTPFWDAVDVIGLTAYYELAEHGETPTVEQLVAAWEPFVRSLESFVAQADQPVVLTEVGYVSQAGAAAAPWNYGTRDTVDLVAQRDLYTALYLAWYDEDWLDGLFLWNWFGDGGSDDSGYTPRLKPSSEIVRHWYRADVSGTR